ncbi:hypothetical protein ACS0PU_000056 [Formica fusca]
MLDVEEQFVEIDDEQFVEINNELLISIVHGNPCLYAKNDKNFKNNKLKDMKWEVIADTLNCTASEARKRWDLLRNQFCRKRRQQKNQPSGSGTLAEWPLMSSMSFLMSHIQNRKTKGSSLLKSTFSTCSETSSNCSINSPVLSPTAACAIQSQNIISCSDSEYSTWNDGHCESLNIENIENIPAEYKLRKVSTKETDNIISIPEISKTQKHGKRKLVPLLDTFAQNKKACNERLEDVLKKSSQAVTDLAVAYKSGRIEEKEKISDPNANVIAQALKSVAPENQLSYLIAVLQLIESFNH